MKSDKRFAFIKQINEITLIFKFLFNRLEDDLF